MEAIDIEGVPVEWCARAGLDPAQPRSAIMLAIRSGMSVEIVPGLPSRAEYVANDNAIRVRAGLPHVATNFLVAHEMGESVLAEQRFVSEHCERIASNLAAVFVAPRPAFYVARLAFGLDLEALADEFTTSQTVCALRWGEVFAEPVALISPGRFRLAGPIHGMPPERELRRIAQAGGCRELRVVPLTDTRKTLMVLGNW
jgi:hypothetical protein